MQEMTTAQKILEDLRKGVKGNEIKSVVLEVGELADITPEELASQLKETAGFDFSIDERKGKIRCKCGYEGMAEILDRNGEVFFICSKCGEIPEVIEGGDVRILNVKVKD